MTDFVSHEWQFSIGAHVNRLFGVGEGLPGVQCSL